MNPCTVYTYYTSVGKLANVDIDARPATYASSAAVNSRGAVFHYHVSCDTTSTAVRSPYHFTGSAVVLPSGYVERHQFRGHKLRDRTCTYVKVSPMKLRCELATAVRTICAMLYQILSTRYLVAGTRYTVSEHSYRTPIYVRGIDHCNTGNKQKGLSRLDIYLRTDAFYTNFSKTITEFLSFL